MIARAQWNQFVNSVPGGSFLQSWEWGAMQEKLGVPYWRLAVESDGKVEIGALVLKRQLPWGKSWLYVPKGPAFAPPTGGATAGKPLTSILQQVIDLAQREGVVFVRIEPHFAPPSGWQKATNDVQPRHTLVLDLTKSADELLGEMRAKTRYNIRLAERKGVRVRIGVQEEDLERFLRLSRDVRERSAFHYHPDNYYRAMRAALSPAGAFEIAVAEYAGGGLAVHLLIYFGDTATYVHGASSSTKRELMAPHFLQWESIKRAKEKGYAKYDFWGVGPASHEASQDTDALRHQWAGITRFKEGFGGRRVSYLGAYDYVLEPVWYWTYGTSRKAKGLLR